MTVKRTVKIFKSLLIIFTLLVLAAAALEILKLGEARDADITSAVDEVKKVVETIGVENGWRPNDTQ